MFLEPHFKGQRSGWIEGENGGINPSFKTSKNCQSESRNF